MGNPEQRRFSLLCFDVDRAISTRLLLRYRKVCEALKEIAKTVDAVLLRDEEALWYSASEGDLHLCVCQFVLDRCDDQIEALRQLNSRGTQV